MMASRSWNSWPALLWLGTLVQVVLLTLMTLPNGVLTLNLDGSDGSYVQYPAWDMCLNGSVSLQFKTQEKNALLLYLHRADKLFFELKLNGGHLKLRANFGLGHVEISTAHDPEVLSDGQWHSVEVTQDGDVTSLNVDGVLRKKSSPKVKQSSSISSSSSFSSLSGVPSPSSSTSSSSSSSSSNSSSLDQQSSAEAEAYVFMGGLPREYQSKKQKALAVPFVVFEPRFRGSVRNFFYQNCTGASQRPEILSSSGILTHDIDRCERENPCLNGGRCLTTDAGRICDCENTEYKGDRCDLQKFPSDATFLGAQYISYNLSNKGGVMVSNVDNINLDFRTKQPSSLLFYIGNSKDFITVVLKDGGIVVNVNLGSGSLRREIRPNRVRFDDNKWHQLHIRREAQHMNIEVDGMYQAVGSTTGGFVRLSSNVLYVAGSPDTKSLLGNDKVDTNFKGCMRKVRYQADNIRIDLTSLARERHSLLTVVGDVLFDKCQELAESHPVTFATPDSYITVTTWDRSRSKGSIAFQFRTAEKGGLIMYSNGNRDSKDFFALEIMDGQLYLVFNMGSGIQKVKATDASIADGTPHDVFFEFYDNKGSISVDGRKAQFSTALISDRFDLHGELYVGGIGSAINASALPREIWSAMFGLFYVGCLQDLVVNGNMVDLVGTARVQNRSNVVGYCRKMEPQCVSHPCTHHGRCVEGWNRFTCDCRATGYTGDVCQTAAVTLRFDGTQYLKVSLPQETVTEAEDISLRFRTMHGSGLLFYASGPNGDSLELYLEQGALFLSVIVGSGAGTLSAGHTLGDDRWHTVIIRRRLNIVEVAIDAERAVRDHIPGNAFAMTTSKIFVGLSASPQRDAMIPYSNRRLRERSLEPSNLMLRDDNRVMPGRYSGFIGSMQSFVFNGKDFFQMASQGDGTIEKTAQVDPDEHVVREPVTFKSVDAYAVLPRLQAHGQFSISLQFKTTEKNGLILYNGGSGDDFLAIELSHGFLYYVYNMGEGPQRVKANVNRLLNDNKWHELRLLRVELTKQLLRVDDNTPTIDDLSGAKNNLFDLDGKLYLGGVEKTMYPSLPKEISSRHGFVGCLASLDLNGYLPNVLREAKPITESVGDGCRGPITRCVNDSCANFGRCVQQWNSYSCDCDMTSYTGPMCTDDSVSYKFGPRPGLISFTYPREDQPTTTSDSLAFGFQTFQENAVLLRIDSVNFDDFIQVELLEGNVYVMYNMGTIDHPIGSFSRKANDGKYHVVRFTRARANATLQVDSEMPLRKDPTGKQWHTFNNQAYIKIGGNKAHNESIVKHFEGLISGLVLNGVRMFELAKEEDPRIKMEGSVSLHRKTRTAKSDLFTDDEDLGEMQSTQPHTTTRDGVTEDIIYAGSGCELENSEDCSVLGSGTDEEAIITPVVIVTSTTTPRPTPPSTPNPTPPCKGPDCESSSRLRLNPDSGVTRSPKPGHGSGSEPGSRSGSGSDSGSGSGFESEDGRHGYNVNGQHGIDHGGYDGQQHSIDDYDEDSTAEPGKQTDKGGSGINLGLILGVLGSVLLAVIVLAIAFCKLRSRDEGTYKVDETQNFSALQSKKTQGNGAMASGSESGGKRGKKKDVKEWYV